MFRQKFVLSVSGGVDSMVLLDMIAKRNNVRDENNQVEYVVAHFNHGIRPDADRDETLVVNTAKKHGFDYEVGYGNLGELASEDRARIERYNFLRRVKNKHNAEKIITAHHQDDLLETIIINVIRGTGPRGLNPMQGQDDILRPMLSRTKQSILEYARENNVEWREDSTNSDERFLRNNVRKNVMPSLAPRKEELLAFSSKINELYSDIDTRIQLLLPKKNVLSRIWFVSLPYCLQKEIIRAWLIRSGIEDIDKKLIERLTITCKTLLPGSKVDVNGELWLKSEKQNVLLVSK